MDAERGPRGRGEDFAIAPLDIIDPIDFQGQPIPTRAWVWEGWVPFGAVTALYGDGGTGKSLLAQQLLTAVTAGQPFLGFTVPRAKGLGVFCEDEKDELHRRQNDINRTLDIDFADLEHMKLVSRVGQDNLLMTFAPDGRGEPTALFHQIRQYCRDEGVQLVLIDTAADTFGGNENIRPQVRQFINLLTGLALAIKGAVILLAHPSQTGKQTGSGDGGSTAWSNSVRSRLYLKRPDTAGGDAVDPNLRILTRLKANYAAMGAEITVRWDAGGFVNTVDPTLMDAEPDVSGRSQRMRDAEEFFLSGMNELAAKSIRVNAHRGQANYAPKSLREKTIVCATLPAEELEQAMNRLIKAGRITVKEDGPPSRRRSYLVMASPHLPGL